MQNNFYRNKKVLITGGLGFIGSNLAIALVNFGAKVEIIDALFSEYGGNRFNIWPIKDKVKIEIADIRNTAKVAKIIQKKEIIFNLAGTLSHIDSMSDPMTDLEINCRAQLSLLENVRKYNRDVRIIYAGTRNQYGKAQYLPVDEGHPMEPTDINGINNIAAEKYHLMYTNVYGIRTVSLRLTNTYGPRHQMKHSRQGVLNYFIRQIINNDEIKLFGTGSQIRDVNYVDDIVEAILRVPIVDDGWGEAYNLGGIPISLADFVKKAIEIEGRGRLRKVVFPPERRKIEIGDYIADYSKFAKKYSWKPIVSLNEGIKKTIDYYKENKEYYW